MSSEFAETAHGKLLAQLRLAVSFLTIVPVLGREPASQAEVAASFAWFPAVGAVLGALLAAEDWLLSPILGHAIRSIAIILSLTVVTGAVHLDGLSDTFDALGARGDRARTLEVLRDSRIGVFGAAAIFFSLGLKIVALAGLGGWKRIGALILAPALARWAMVAVSYRMEYLRAQGAGSALLGSEGAGRNLAIASATAAALVAVLISRAGSCAAALSIVAAAAIRLWYRRWMGGVTGDLIGACGEMVETIVLIAFAS